MFCCVAAAASAQPPAIVLSGAGETRDSTLILQSTIGQMGAAIVTGDNQQLRGGFAFLSIEPAPIDSSLIRLSLTARVLVGDVALGDTTIHQLTIRNDGFTPVPLVIASDATSFVPVPGEVTVAAMQSVVIDIHFSPVSVGDIVGTLSVTGPDQMQLSLVELSGYGGILPEGPLSIDFGLGPGDQNVRQVGGAVSGSIFTAELHAATTSTFSGWQVIVDLQPGLNYVADSFSPSDLIPDIVVVSSVMDDRLSISGTSPSSQEGTSRRALLGTFQIEVTGAFMESAALVISQVSVDLQAVAGTPELVRSTAVITTRASDPLPGDFDESGIVGLDDFFLFADAFHQQILRFDLNADGVVNFRDFFIFADLFGTHRE
jgi:hypothetical protein